MTEAQLILTLPVTCPEPGFDTWADDERHYQSGRLPEVCAECHPFYTGKQKLVDTGGRIDRFERRYGRRGK